MLEQPDLGHPGQIESLLLRAPELTDKGWVIPPAGYLVRFSFDLSMVRSAAPWFPVVEIKPLDFRGNSMGVVASLDPVGTGAFPLTGWSDLTASELPNAVYQAINNTAIPLVSLYHRPGDTGPRHWFVVYLKNPRDPWGNLLNPVARLFALTTPETPTPDPTGDQDIRGEAEILIPPASGTPGAPGLITDPKFVFSAETTRVAVTAPDGVDTTGAAFTITGSATILGVERMSRSVFVLTLRTGREERLTLAMLRAGKVVAGCGLPCIRR